MTIHPASVFFPTLTLMSSGDLVISISLGSSCAIRFTHALSGRAEEYFIESRSLLILSGDARREWAHEIPSRAEDRHKSEKRIRSRRVSLTFRTVPAPAASLEA